MLTADQSQAAKVENFVSDMRRMARRFLRSGRAADQLARKTILRAQNEYSEEEDQRKLRLHLVTIMRDIVVSENGEPSSRGD
jgi:DNA-directed RNA polymerase specialized sigma24 family protein